MKLYPRILAATFVLTPVLLFWYGSSHCQELACIGPIVNAQLAVITVVPLLLLWWKRRRAIYPAMLAGAEAAMIFATLRRDFDFSPQFMVVAIPAGLVVGFVAGSMQERLRNPRDSDG